MSNMSQEKAEKVGRSVVLTILVIFGFPMGMIVLGSGTTADGLIISIFIVVFVEIIVSVAAIIFFLVKIYKLLIEIQEK